MRLTKNKVRVVALLLAAALIGVGLVAYSYHDTATSLISVKKPSQAQGSAPTSNGALDAMTAEDRSAATVSSGQQSVPALSAKASIQVGTKSYQMQSNAIGGAISSFDPVSLSPKQRVHITMSYPDGEANQMVVLEAEDGGLIDGKVPAKVVQLDASGGLAFDFNAGTDAGQNRVVLRNGASQTVLHFAVGSASVN